MQSVIDKMGCAVAGAVLLLCCADARVSAQDEVELLYSPSAQTVMVGDEFEIGIIARSVPGWDVPMSAMSVIVSWDASKLELLGINNNGPYEWGGSYFANDAPFDNLNEGKDDPPWYVPDNDGDALYEAISQITGDRPQATASGLLATSFVFRALEPTEGTELSMPLATGLYTETYVISGRGGVGGEDILAGTPAPASVKILPEPGSLGLLVLGGWLMMRFRRGWL